ncbi:hypothetical protein BRARA_A03313 [Brassica rapa]|uniref:Uncharacterized protein n=1 Tax=Brassica campestris TaxID=3711 RepID=A0A398ASG1_BRACM|nr:hypothetical protein BRARA_A03313 [Brassica rapa]
MASSRAITPGSTLPSKSSKLAPPPVEMNHLLTSVPAANFSISNTPIGPFQITVCVVSKASLNVFIESGPMSNPIHPSSIPDADTTYKTSTSHTFTQNTKL